MEVSNKIKGQPLDVEPKLNLNAVYILEIFCICFHTPH